MEDFNLIIKYKKIIIGIGIMAIIIGIGKFMHYKITSRNTLGKIIVIDAGHGDNDPGTTSINGDFEKDINLEIAKRLNRDLRKMGYRTLMTREKDIFIEPAARAEFANDKDALLFISIHCNAIENNEGVKGLQVLHYPEIEESIILSKLVMESMLVESGAEDRGIVPRDKLIVLNQTRMPSIIVECGFLTNGDEARLLMDEEYQKKVSLGMALGIEEYIESIKTKEIKAR